MESDCISSWSLLIFFLFKITKIYFQKKSHYVTFLANNWKVPYQIHAFNLTTVDYCLADHGQTIQSLAKCGSCHCIFRLLQTFLPLSSCKMIVNLNNQSGSQYLTEWLLIYFSDEIVRFFYCKTNHRSQQPHKSANKIICAIISACYFALK